jgi:beta-lactamase class A
MMLGKADMSMIGMSWKHGIQVVLAGCLAAQPLAAASKAHAQSDANDGAISAELDELWRKFPGRTGIAIITPFSNDVLGRRVDEDFPQQSVSKMWVALTILEQIASGEISQEKLINVTHDDLVVFNQPIARYLKQQSHFKMTVRELLEHSIVNSDNLANNVLLRVAGGPKAVNTALARRGLRNIKFGPGEALLQTSIAGLEWKPEFRYGNSFKLARSKLPRKVREAALKTYLVSPPDRATPKAIVQTLKDFARAKPEHPGARLLDLMSRTATGRSRLRAGLGAGWKIAHKTGTGQVLGSISTAINDVGVLTASDGCKYYVAIMIADTNGGTQGANTLMRDVTRLIVRQHETLHGYKGEEQKWL